MTKHSHRHSSLKQVNKPFKGSKNSKKKKKKFNQTPIATKPFNVHLTQTKHERSLSKQQQRNQKLQNLKLKQRLGADPSSEVPPRIVMLLPMCDAIDPFEVKVTLLKAAGMDEMFCEAKPVTFSLPSWCRSSSRTEAQSSQLTLIDVNPYKYSATSNESGFDEKKSSGYCSTTMLHYVLDIAKVANVIVLLFSKPNCAFNDPPFDSLGYKLLSALRLQGMPTPIGLLVTSEPFKQLPFGKQKENVKLIQRFFVSECGNDKKFMVMDTGPQEQNVLRLVCRVTPKEFPWRGEIRGYIMSEHAQLLRNENDSQHFKFIVEGFCRGVGFSVRHPIHITGVGDALIDSIAEVPFLGPEKRESTLPIVLERLTPDLEAEALQEWEPLRPFNSLDGEQTWPSAKELELAARGKRKQEKTGHFWDPSGVDRSGSDQYSSDCSDHNNEEQEEDADFDMINECVEENTQEMLSDSQLDQDSEASFDYNALALTSEDYQPRAKRFKTFTLEERSREDMEFPDEIDIDPSIQARERLNLYRGLKSFRSSYWDPYEDLPNEYSRIYEFDSFNASMRYGRQVFKENCLAANNGTPMIGKYIRLEIRLSQHSPSEAAKVDLIEKRLGSAETADHPFIISTLLPYERKVTVCHAMLHRRDDYEDPLPSKTPVLLQCGFRRFMIRPIYSQIGSRSLSCLVPHKTAKLKYERFFHPHTTVFVTFYGPTLYTAAPVLLIGFNSQESQLALYKSLSLPETCAIAAWGNCIAPSPLRVIVKRVVLTGYPFRVHKRKAVIRYMFFNSADVRWFKPVELCTKKGLRGHIKEPLGTHGYMKCAFSQPLDQSDTICMHLYKRVFPKWFTPSWGDLSESPFNAN